MDETFAVQKALVAALTAALAPVKVFDDPPPDQPFPFLAIGRQFVEQQDTFSEGLQRHDVTITVFSTYRGQKEVLGLMAQAYAALHDKVFPLDVGTCVGCRVRARQTTKDSDGATYTGNIDVSVIVET